MDITAPKRVQRARRSRFVRFLGFISALCLVVCLAVASAAGFILWKASKDLPDYEVLAKYEPAVTTRVYANDGNLIAEFARERRIYVPITAIPNRVIQAFISAEDKTFYQHGGLDLQGILRAAITNLTGHGDHKMGASTITQQVAKNLLLNPNLRVSEIGFEVGFQSLTHFNRVFKKILGQSPTEYRVQLVGTRG